MFTTERREVPFMTFEVTLAISKPDILRQIELGAQPVFVVTKTHNIYIGTERHTALKNQFQLRDDEIMANGWIVKDGKNLRFGFNTGDFEIFDQIEQAIKSELEG
jgi:hypothetical protein